MTQPGTRCAMSAKGRMLFSSLTISYQLFHLAMTTCKPHTSQCTCLVFFVTAYQSHPVSLSFLIKIDLAIGMSTFMVSLLQEVV